MTDLVSLLMLLAGTCLFMIAGVAVCITLSIFCDIINLRGGFEKIGGIVIAAIFVPILLAGKLLDVIMVLFVPAQIKRSLLPPTVTAETSTITV